MSATGEGLGVEDRNLTKAAITEFIGPFALVFAGIGAIIARAGIWSRSR